MTVNNVDTKWQFSVLRLIWGMSLVAMALAFVRGIPPRNPFSGPLYLLDMFEEDRFFVYSWAVLMLIAIIAYPAWPRRWTAAITLGGFMAWIISSLFVRFSIDW